MNDPIANNEKLRPWIEPEFRVLDVRATAAAPGIGADVGGNPSIDCQRS